MKEWKTFVAILILLLPFTALLLLNRQPPRQNAIEVVEVQDIQDASCTVAVYLGGVYATEIVRRGVPCSVASGPLEIDFGGLGLCIAPAECNLQLAASGTYWGDEPLFITVLAPNHPDSSVTIEVDTPKG